MTVLSVPYALGQVGVTGGPDAFARVGFNVSENGLLATLNGAIAFSGVGDDHVFLGIGAVGPTIPAGVNIDGVAVVNSEVVPPVDHPNGTYELDHLVIFTPDLDRTAKHTEAVLGMRQLRVRDTGDVRQSFHRFADVHHPDGSVTKGCVLELVHSDRVDAAQLWGVAFNTYDLAGMCATFGTELIGEPHDAVQEGRSIASFRPAAELGIHVAMMTPVPTSAPTDVD